MRALVLGATGHVGHAFTRELLARGWEVSAASRGAGSSALLAGLPVCRRAGDTVTPGQLAEWVRGHDLVVDAAAPYHFRLAPLAGERALCTAERRMRALLESVSAQRARLIYVSSFTTLRRPRSLLGAARAALLSQLHPYFELKRRMEAQVRAAARGGLEAVIVNPTLCLGPFDAKPLEFCLIPLVLRGELPATHGHAVNVIDVRDVAAAALAALAQRCFGEPIPLCGHNTTLHGLVAAICRRGRVRPPRLRVPAPLTAAVAYGNEVLASLRLSPLDYPSLGMLLALEQHWDSPGAVQRRLGTRLRPLSRTLADAIEWYAALGYLEAEAGAGAPGLRPATSRLARIDQAQAALAASQSRHTNQLG
jgi:dihydroflavonol-4-reductase